MVTLMALLPLRDLLTVTLAGGLLLQGCSTIQAPATEPAAEVSQTEQESASKPPRRATRKRPKQTRAKTVRRARKSAPQKLPDVIEAEEFRIVDKDGNVRASLRLNEKGAPGLALFDDDGRLRAVLQVLEDGSPHLLFLDENGNTPTSLHSLP